VRHSTRIIKYVFNVKSASSYLEKLGLTNSKSSKAYDEERKNRGKKIIF